MNFLLDTNICSAHLRRPARLAHKLEQYSGRLFISTVVLGELYAWAYRRDKPSKLLAAIEDDLTKDVAVLHFDELCAFEFGKLRGSFIKQGIAAETADLMIAATALVHELTLVTNNVKDFQRIPNLQIVDWLTP
jgi:tRNA(fMet)-specific endonuclease VapC